MYFPILCPQWARWLWYDDLFTIVRIHLKLNSQLLKKFLFLHSSKFKNIWGDQNSFLMWFRFRCLRSYNDEFWIDFYNCSRLTIHSWNFIKPVPWKYTTSFRWEHNIFWILIWPSAGSTQYLEIYETLYSKIHQSECKKQPQFINWKIDRKIQELLSKWNFFPQS